jgi:hypothetical protein
MTSRLVVWRSSLEVQGTERAALSLHGAHVQEARHGGFVPLTDLQMHWRLLQTKMRVLGCLDSVEQYAADRQRMLVRQR